MIESSSMIYLLSLSFTISFAWHTGTHRDTHTFFRTLHSLFCASLVGSSLCFWAQHSIICYLSLSLSIGSSSLAACVVCVLEP